MAIFPGNEDMWMHIRFGEPVPARTFPDPEAARTYVLSGLDTALELIRARIYDHRHDHLLEKDCGYELGVHITHQIHRLRDGLVAAPPLTGRIAAACRELRIIGGKARAVHDECRRRIRRLHIGMAMLFCVFVLASTILPNNLAPLMIVIWRLWNGGVEERLSELRRKQAVAAEIERAAFMVAGIACVAA